MKPQLLRLPGFDGGPAPSVDQSGVPLEVVRSARRVRTVGARVVDGVLRVTIPSWMSKSEEEHWVGVMVAKHRRRISAERIDLSARARELAHRYDLRRPSRIRWTGDMSSRWGSCTPASGEIRLSSRLATFPAWVVDYVIVHELAHLSVAGHDQAFWHLVYRFPRAERAIGYLIAKSATTDDPQHEDRGPMGEMDDMSGDGTGSGGDPCRPW